MEKRYNLGKAKTTGSRVVANNNEPFDLELDTLEVDGENYGVNLNELTISEYEIDGATTFGSISIKNNKTGNITSFNTAPLKMRFSEEEKGTREVKSIEIFDGNKSDIWLITKGISEAKTQQLIDTSIQNAIGNALNDQY